MPDLDRIIADAVAVADADGEQDHADAVHNLAAFMADDNASMMGGWT